jgi:hypothetical protein
MLCGMAAQSDEDASLVMRDTIDRDRLRLHVYNGLGSPQPAVELLSEAEKPLVDLRVDVEERACMNMID